jgi:hypothetical protein
MTTNQFISSLTHPSPSDSFVVSLHLFKRTETQEQKQKQQQQQG